MIDKKIKSRITVLESLYPTEYANVDEYVKELNNTYKNILGHPININLPNKKYYDKENIERDFFERMDIEDLRFLANTIIYERNKIKK